MQRIGVGQRAVDVEQQRLLWSWRHVMHSPSWTCFSVQP
jgi:hypothetical protein